MVISDKEYEIKKTFFRLYPKTIDLVISKTLDKDMPLSTVFQKITTLEGIGSIQYGALSIVEEDFICYSFSHVMFQIECINDKELVNFEDSDGVLYYYDENSTSMPEPIVKVYVSNLTMQLMVDTIRNKEIKIEIGIYANLYVPKINEYYDYSEEKLFKVNHHMKASLASFAIRETIQKSISDFEDEKPNFELAREDLGANYINDWIDIVWKWADENNIPRLSTSEPFDYRDDSYWVGLSRNKKQFLTTRIINLEKNQLVDLPKSIFNLTKMTKLNLHNNFLKEIPNEIIYVTNLSELDIGRNTIDVLPEGIWSLINLTKLNISSNGFNKIPKGIGNLNNLITLKASGNKIENLPCEIFNLTNLCTLDIGFNSLTSLNNDIGKLQKLQTLNISYNKFLKLPDMICSLESLTMLDIHHNNLVELPYEIGNLISLTTLDIGDNPLVELPKSITKLTNLVSLNLSKMNRMVLTEEHIKWLNRLLVQGCYVRLDKTSYEVINNSIVLLKFPLEDKFGIEHTRKTFDKKRSKDENEMVETGSRSLFKFFVRWIKTLGFRR